MKAAKKKPRAPRKKRHKGFDMETALVHAVGQNFPGVGHGGFHPTMCDGCQAALMFYADARRRESR